MDQNKVNSALKNRAKTNGTEQVLGDDCQGRVLFHLRDNDYEFSLDLTTVLQCLEFAILDGDLPKLPAGWCEQVAQNYGVFFDDGAQGFENRALADSAEKVICDNCPERVLFHLKDNEHEFSMGLTTVLQCLEFAILDGDLPKLPAGWCEQVAQTYGLWYDPDVQYFEEARKNGGL